MAALERLATAVRSLLISGHNPSRAYGTGQRLLSLKRALSDLGECRFVWLHPEATPSSRPEADYYVSSGVPHQPTRGYWIRRQLSFWEFRRSVQAQSALAAIHEDYPFDLVVCSFFHSAIAAPDQAYPCILDADALPAPETRLQLLLWPATLYMMRRRASHFGKVFIINAQHRLLLNGSNTILLPGISATGGPPIAPNPDASHLLFVGSQRWPPNAQAVEFLVSRVLPRLREANIRFSIRLVGEGTEAWARVPGISAGGFVADMELEYRRAAVVLCPVWSGSGANVKLAEALQYGCAVLASEHAARAFEGVLESGRPVLVARQPESYAQALLDLLSDPERISSLRCNAREFAARVLTQQAFSKIVQEAVSETLQAWRSRATTANSRRRQ